MAPFRTDRASLPERVATELVKRLAEGEWAPGERLPPESHLSEDLGVSRVTIRSALQRLEMAGVIVTRHGVGTFVADRPASSIRAGLEELRSISATIGAQGRSPSASYRVREFRPLDEVAAAKLGQPVGTSGLYLERVLFADKQPIAFSYGTVARDSLPPDFSPEALQDSVFDYLGRFGLLPEYAEATLKPIHDPAVGWDPHRPDSHLYLLLEQVQYLSDQRPLSWSRIYFIEDRFQFDILRRRSEHLPPTETGPP